MASTDLADSINDHAAQWAVEAAHGVMTPEKRAALDAWLLADRRHRGAYIRACAWLRAAEAAVVESSVPEDRLPHPASDNDNDLQAGTGSGSADDRSFLPTQNWRQGLRRWGIRTTAGAAAMAASVAALLAVGVPMPMLPWQDRPAATGDAAGAQLVRLRDGSSARLSPDARIQVALSNDARTITLLSGEAVFDVAHDAARPFVVRAGHVYAQAVGTIYSVSRVGLTGGMVKVSEGTVLVWPHDERDQAVRLLAGGTLTLDPGPMTGAQPGGAPVRQMPAPHTAQISLDNVSIAAAALRFNRVNSTKIIVADREIGDITVIGHYQANDPGKFARSAAEIANADIEYSDGNIVIKMK